MKIHKFIWRTLEIIVFIALLSCCYKKINHLFINKVGMCDTISTFYEEKKNECDVVFVGSSHAYRAFSPMELWHNTGITSYTLASPAQPMAASYYLTKEAIRTQHPKLIVLEMYGFRYETDFREENLHTALDAMPLSLNKLCLYKDYLSKKVGWDEGLTFMIPMLLYHQRWDSLEKNDYVQELSFLNGYQYSVYKDPQKKPGTIKGEKAPDAEIMEYLDRIIEECNKAGVELLLAGAPMPKSNRNRKSIRRFNYTASYAAEKGVPSIIMNRYLDEIGIDFENDFYDSTHLNAYGGKKVTSFIGDYIQEHYDITDHRNDPAYSQWDEDYAAYLEYEALLPTTGIVRDANV